MMAILQPVRYPGSSPMMTCPDKGAWSNKLRKFVPNTLIACSSACSVIAFRVSRSNDGYNSRLYPSAIASAIYECSTLAVPCTVSTIYWINVSSGTTKLTFKAPKLSPRFIANTRWDGTWRIGSLYSSLYCKNPWFTSSSPTSSVFI